MKKNNRATPPPSRGLRKNILKGDEQEEQARANAARGLVVPTSPRPRVIPDFLSPSPLCHEAGLTAHSLASISAPPPATWHVAFHCPFDQEQFPGRVTRGVSEASRSEPRSACPLLRSPPPPWASGPPRERFISSPAVCLSPGSLLLAQTLAPKLPDALCPLQPTDHLPPESLTVTWHPLPLTPATAPPARGAHPGPLRLMLLPAAMLWFCKECMNSKGKRTSTTAHTFCPFNVFKLAIFTIFKRTIRGGGGASVTFRVLYNQLHQLFPKQAPFFTSLHVFSFLTPLLVSFTEAV